MSVFTKADICHPKRHFFDLSYENKFTFDMGQLIPICWQDVIPNDKVKIGVQHAIRFQPTVAPFMHNINVYTHWFFVPSRLLFKDDDIEGMDKDKIWENFITGGIDGELNVELPKFTSNISDFTVARYMGYPMVMPIISEGGAFKGFSKLPVRAYNKIYNDYYRDENLISEVDLDNNTILLSAWKKDYFTSALTEQQRGPAPELSFTFKDSPVLLDKLTSGYSYPRFARGNDTTFDYEAVRNYSGSDTHLRWGDDPSSSARFLGKTDTKGSPFLKDGAGKNLLYADNSKLTASFNASDLRLLMQVQKWQERNERAGIRYTSFLKSHYGISPRDEVLQRPEYIGGSKSVVSVSEIPQTSASQSEGSKQGNLAGKATSADVGYIGTYTVKEFGYIIGIAKVIPELGYTAQGARKHLINYSRFDYYSPEFANLSEAPVFDVQLFTSTEAGYDPFHIFGYQAVWNEMRANQNQAVCGMDDDFSHWNLNRIFGNAPQLNKDFIECNGAGAGLKRIFAVPSEKGLVGTFVNNLYMYRPLPRFSQPGLIDHTYGG